MSQRRPDDESVPPPLNDDDEDAVRPLEDPEPCGPALPEDEDEPEDAGA